MRNKIIENAIKEMGYKEGEKNSNKYSKELYNKSQEWCADFIRWLFEKCGAGDLFPVSSYVPTVAEWFDKKGQYKNSKAYGGNYIPIPGDLILFDYNRNTTSDHIGIVEKVEGNKVHTIEGNKDNMVRRCIYDISSKDIRAYCVPAYPGEKKEKYKTVTARSGLNIREKSTTVAKRIGGIACGEKVQVLQENVTNCNGHNWDKIIHMNTVGYVANTYLK